MGPREPEEPKSCAGRLLNWLSAGKTRTTKPVTDTEPRTSVTSRPAKVPVDPRRMSGALGEVAELGRRGGRRGGMK